MTPHPRPHPDSPAETPPGTVADPPSGLVHSSATLLDRALERARLTPDAKAFTFLDRGSEVATLTYAELDRSARRTAALLQHSGATPGDRVLLSCSPGVDYVIAFWACVYAGMAAVPAYPPRRRNSARLAAIVTDAGAVLMLGNEEPAAWPDEDTTGPRRLALADADTFAPGDWRTPEINASTVAFLQYTSGSTAAPKGVIVRHGNVVHNLTAIETLFQLGPQTRAVLWLPPYHDMGLIGGLLQPVHTGFPIVLMPPQDFVRSPGQWLQVITRYRATASGGPDFAYDWCVDRIDPALRERLDLSSWQVAFTGAEPIRARTLTRFADAFAAAGFDRSRFLPCYGAAEATLLITGQRDCNGPTTLTVSRRSVERGEVAPSDDDGDRTTTLVGCGRPVPGQRVEVVDPRTHRRLPAGGIGEVWVAGPSVATGYQGGRSPETFGVPLADGDDTGFVRTGDLGFSHDGELFITGRLKDLIVVRGRNHHPEDIELTVRERTPAVGTCAAFSVDDGIGERLVIVGETRAVEAADAIPLIRQAIYEEHELQVPTIVLVVRGSLPRTSSGKVRRGECRRQYLDGSLRVITMTTPATDDEAPTAAVPDTPRPTSASVDAHTTAVADALERALVESLGRPAGTRLDPDTPLGALGLDSLTAVVLQHRVETELGLALDTADLHGGITATQLLDAALRARAAVPVTTSTAAEPTALSYGQRAMWFLQQLSPTSAAHNISIAFRLVEGVDHTLLQEAVRTLLDRHHILRSRFESRDGVPVRTVSPDVGDVVRVIDAAPWSQTELRDRLSEAAREPFDLARPPLMRVQLFDGATGGPVVLITTHHIVTDMWSMSLLLQDFTATYQALRDQTPAALAPSTASYGDYVAWQRELLTGETGQRLWEYWRNQLDRLPPPLELPADHPRPPADDVRGASVARTLPPELVGRITALAGTHGSTLSSALLAAYTVFLHRHAQADDIVVGFPAAARGRAAWSSVAGYFVNPLPVRTDLSGNPRFVDLLTQVGTTVRDALVHQDFPFPLMVERLDVARDVAFSPVFQTMFIMQQSPGHGTDSGPLAAGCEEIEVRPHGLPMRAVAVPDQPAQFDLTLLAAEVPGGLRLTLQYRSAVFTGQTAERMLDRLVVLLSAAVDDPASPVLDLPLLTPAETEELAAQAAATASAYESDLCIHQMFERQAQRHPDNVAVVHEHHQTTYAALDRQADALADQLRLLGVTRGSLVGLCLQRSTALVAGLLAILKTGAAYVPLDPTHPPERLAATLRDTSTRVVVTDSRSEYVLPGHLVRLHADADHATVPAEVPIPASMSPDLLAYVTYTSGTTGAPKGVMVTHRNVANLFAGLDTTIGCDARDSLLAVTGITFDISVLELLWTLCRGAKVVLLSDGTFGTGEPRQSAGTRREIAFSLFYFASDDARSAGDPYRLLLAGARFADQHGFEAVWTPERHFHQFGGPYPNPSVTSAALATATSRIQIRAGSVVLPLHHPIRIAEEWATIDNLSGGRTAIAFASGWHPDDFAFFPDHYADRYERTWAGIEEVRRLWRGEAVRVATGTGGEREVRTYPRPVQSELPVWVTAAGRPDTFRRAGELGANVLTHLLGQSVEEIAEKIACYRQARSDHGHDPQQGRVTLMLHTFVGEDAEDVRERVRQPFMAYLRSSTGLVSRFATSHGMAADLDSLSPRDLDDLLRVAFDRYVDTAALFGTPETCRQFVERLADIGVDEVACLIDFGVDVDEVLANLPHLDRLRSTFAPLPPSAAGPLPSSVAAPTATAAEQMARHQVNLLQCTPSGLRLLLATEGFGEQLAGLRTLLLGGEALPRSLADEALTLTPALRNMYGPTETTVWSTSHPLHRDDPGVPIGCPLANTRAYVLDARLRHTPAGVPGELWLAGLGVAAGYLDRPGLTAERFVADPYAPKPGARMYRTGDQARRRPDGTLEFLGRVDDQVKIRGHRVELGEIEHALRRHPAVDDAAVVPRETEATTELVACLVTGGHVAPAPEELRRFLGRTLPSHMVPSAFTVLDALPLTPNRKIDRKALRSEAGRRLNPERPMIAPASESERVLTGIVCEILGLERVGVHDNFFSIGGNSLLMVQVHARVREHFRSDVPLVTLFEYPTVRALAAHLSGGDGMEGLTARSADRAGRQRKALRTRRGRQRRG